MSEWTIEGDESMRWDVIFSAEPSEMLPAAVYSDGPEGRVEAPKAIPSGMEGCDGCNGSGTYYGAGSVVNGKFVGFSGQCYRCRGKGHQTPSDVKRNQYYDNHVRRFPV